MTVPAAPSQQHEPRDFNRERRGPPDTRGRAHLYWDVVFTIIRAIGGIAKNFYATFGIFLLVGAIVAVFCTWAFAEFASHVRSGATQAFDDNVLRWMAGHRSPKLDAIMLEITFLGTGTVVMMIVGISGMFLWLTKHRYSALLLLISAFGGIV